MTRRAVALAIHHPDRTAPILLVQRPADDEDLPGAWGLPAASLRPLESWTDAAHRAARDKLGVALDLGPVLEQGSLQRDRYTLEMRLFSATIRHGLPAVPQPHPDVTQYQAWRWGTPSELQPAADAGSLCARLALRWIARTAS